MTCKNRLTENDIKNRIYYYFDDRISVIDLYSKVDKRLYKSVLIYYIGYEASNYVLFVLSLINKSLMVLMEVSISNFFLFLKRKWVISTCIFRKVLV